MIAEEYTVPGSIDRKIPHPAEPGATTVLFLRSAEDAFISVYGRPHQFCTS
jgi:hypothetical protein